MLYRRLKPSVNKTGNRYSCSACFHGGRPYRTLYGLRMHMAVWHKTTPEKIRDAREREIRKGVAAWRNHDALVFALDLTKCWREAFGEDRSPGVVVVARHQITTFDVVAEFIETK